MNRRSLLRMAALMALAGAAWAQGTASVASSTLSTRNLPLRNLQIEVRQLAQDQSGGAAARLGGSVRLQPGASSAQWALAAQERASTQSHDALQQVLVLNGRRASIALRNSVPLWLVQSVVHNGVMTIVPGTVMMESGTGFDATARWHGAQHVDLELSASQGSGPNQAATASTSTWIVAPLGEWVTVAQSDQQSMASGAAASQATSRGTLVQIRVSLR